MPANITNQIVPMHPHHELPIRWIRNYGSLFCAPSRAPYTKQGNEAATSIQDIEPERRATTDKYQIIEPTKKCFQ
jgi:hypothetical protein